MERFISLLLSGIMAGQPINVLDTWYIQETYVIENYFHRTEEMAPMVYRSGRILGQTTTESNQTNETDCSWIWVGYMVELWLLRDRDFTSDGKRVSSLGWLNSFLLYTLWKPENKSDVKRWDFIFMSWPTGERHFAVACDSWWNMIYDFYTNGSMSCRYMDAPVMKYSTNWIVEYLSWNWIILPETQQVLDYFQKIKNDATQSGSIDTGNTSTFRQSIINFIQTVI